YRGMIRIPNLLCTPGPCQINSAGPAFTSSKGAVLAQIYNPGEEFRISFNYEGVGGLLPGENDTITLAFEESVVSSSDFLITEVLVDNHSSINAVGESQDNSAGSNSGGWISLAVNPPYPQGT